MLKLSGAVAAATAAVLVLAGGPAGAVVIKPVFGSSITKLADHAQIEAAFNAVASQLDSSLASKATIYVDVSWGSVAGSALPSGDIGASLDNLLTGFTFADATSYLQQAALANPLDKTLALAAADLPKSDPTHLNNFAIPYAEAKALGLLPPAQNLPDGFIGFSSKVAWDFNPSEGVTKGSYDFESLAAHELEEVLGRITGLQGSRAQWATPFDLFRYARAGVSSFGMNSSAYFSLNRGVTDLGAFNFAGGGDRSDWLTGSGSTDAQDAYLTAGKIESLGKADFTALDALGWDAKVNPGGYGATATGASGASGAAVPEPGAWALLMLGIGLIGARLRRPAPQRLAAVKPG